MALARDLLATPRLGLSRPEAAQFIGVSPSKFDQMVLDRRMPRPKRIDGRRVWDIRALTYAFDELPVEDDPASTADVPAKGEWDDYK